jgi:hypothetical protein
MLLGFGAFIESDQCSSIDLTSAEGRHIRLEPASSVSVSASAMISVVRGFRRPLGLRRRRGGFHFSRLLCLGFGLTFPQRRGFTPGSVGKARPRIGKLMVWIVASAFAGIVTSEFKYLAR